MRRCVVVLSFTIVLLLVSGCKINEPTPEEKQKISDLQVEASSLEKEIEQAESTLNPQASGLIPTLTALRLEQDKLTLSIVNQHIAALESGAKITASISSIEPDLTLAEEINSEIIKAKSELDETLKESALYSGGLIKAMIEARAKTQEFTIASLKQRYLAAKYGLNSTDMTPKNKPQKDAVDPQQPTINKEQKELAEIPIIDDPGPFDFRKTRWGMSVDEVIAREGAPVTREDANGLSYLFYRANVASKNVVLLYAFVDDKLCRALYSLDEKYSNKNNYIDDYHSFVSAITEKYGKPKEEKTYWSNDLYRNDYKERGMAYSIGHVSSYTEWALPTTAIEINASGNNYNISVNLIYKSLELDPLFQEKQKAKQQSGL